MTALGSAAVLLAGGVGLGSTYAMSTSDPAQLLRVAGLELVYLPAVLVPAGIAALVHGWRPGWARVAWVVLAVWFVLGYLGGLLNAPDWLVRSSPFSRTPSVPVASRVARRPARDRPGGAAADGRWRPGPPPPRHPHPLTGPHPGSR